MLTYKPQLCLLVPVALAAARQWLALAAAVLMARALAGAAEFGLRPWWYWLAVVRGGDALFQDWLLTGRLHGQRMFAVATLLGAFPAAAQAAQVLAVMPCAAVAWHAWRIPATSADMRPGVLLIKTLIAAPHVSNYDTVMLTVAVALLLFRAMHE
jgi:hypothetical protein